MFKETPPEAVFNSAAELFSILATPVRLHIISALCNHEKNVSQLLEEVETTQPNMSQHLSTLYRAGLLARRRDGTQIYYRIQSERVALLAGGLFGIGLIASHMTEPLKIKAFLDLAGEWDPSLALVMAAAIAVAYVAFRAARRRPLAWSGAPIDLPNSSQIDSRLIMGGLLFGAGWGLAGLCPGPAMVAAASGSLPAVGFLAAMLAGMALHDTAFTRH